MNRRFNSPHRNHGPLIILVASLLSILTSSEVHASGQCEAYDGGTQVGAVENEALDEASGLAASYINNGVFWAQNDSGNPALLYAIDTTGAVLATYEVSGAINVDWEDLAVGPCPEACSCLFIGDFGDNLQIRVSRTIYRIPEPDLAVDTDGVTAPATELTFDYPDGRWNAETLLVDPRWGHIYVVTKEDSGLSKVYRFPDPDPDSFPVELVKVADITLQGSSSSGLLATGGSVAGDGGRLVVRSLEHAQEYVIPEGELLENAFLQEPLVFRLPAASQGEAISYSTDGMSLFLVSENLPAPVHEVKCLSGSASEPLTPLLTPCEEEAGTCASRTSALPTRGGPTLPAGYLLFLGGALALLRMRRPRSSG